MSTISAKSDQFECASTNFDNHLPPSDGKSDIDDKTTSFLNENIEKTLINKEITDPNKILILILIHFIKVTSSYINK